MLLKIPLLSFLLFGATYPLCFWLTAKKPIGHNFQRFHLACPIIIAGIAIAILCQIPFDQTLRYYALMWLLAGLIITSIFWNKDNVNPVIISLLSLSGISLTIAVYQSWFSLSLLNIIGLVLSGLITSAIFYAMNLGHFYLNVHGLPIIHLINAVKTFTILLIIRLVFDCYQILTATVFINGEPTLLRNFMLGMEGFFLSIGVLFATILPLAGTYFAFGTLKLKNTQATTGILYVLLSALLLGNLACMYYLLKYNISL